MHASLIRMQAVSRRRITRVLAVLLAFALTLVFTPCCDLYEANPAQSAHTACDHKHGGTPGHDAGIPGGVCGQQPDSADAVATLPRAIALTDEIGAGASASPTTHV